MPSLSPIFIINNISTCVSNCNSTSVSKHVCYAKIILLEESVLDKFIYFNIITVKIFWKTSTIFFISKHLHTLFAYLKGCCLGGQRERTLAAQAKYVELYQRKYMPFGCYA